MANTTRNNRFYFFLLFFLTSTFVLACPSGSYVSPKPRDFNVYTGSDYGSRDAMSTSTGTSSTFHAGWDLNPNQGQASHGGNVTYGYTSGHGNTIIVTDGNFRTVYAHACTMNTSLNQVSAGQSLGNWSACCTGSCTGNHIHYETQVKDSAGYWRAVDPAIVSSMAAQGKDLCDPAVINSIIQQTATKHGHVASGFSAGGMSGTGAGSGGGSGTPVQSGGMCGA